MLAPGNTIPHKERERPELGQGAPECPYSSVSVTSSSSSFRSVPPGRSLVESRGSPFGWLSLCASSLVLCGHSSTRAAVWIPRL